MARNNRCNTVKQGSNGWAVRSPIAGGRCAGLGTSVNGESRVQGRDGRWRDADTVASGYTLYPPRKA